jgi:large subunit ribosomal protein L1
VKKLGKRAKALVAAFDTSKLYDPGEAVAIVKKNANAKFNETVEIHVRLGVDPKKSDQNVRGTVSLPHGTGKTVRVIAFAKGDKLKEAEAAGGELLHPEHLTSKGKRKRKRPAPTSSARTISSKRSRAASPISTSRLRRRT